MNDEKVPIMCKDCNVEMIPKMADKPFDRAPTTVSSTLPGESDAQLNVEHSESDHDIPEYIEYVCPKCPNTKLVKVS